MARCIKQFTYIFNSYEIVVFVVIHQMYSIVDIEILIIICVLCKMVYVFNKVVILLVQENQLRHPNVTTNF